MKYVDYKAKQQKEFNKLPMKAAFGDKQFEEMMAEWDSQPAKEFLSDERKAKVFTEARKEYIDKLEG